MAFKRSELFGGHTVPHFIVGITLALAGCATSPIPSITGAVCDFGDVVIDGSFEGGRVSGCRKQGNRYVVATRPEATPINPSPWFAFDVTSQSKDRVKITLDYGDFEHRYSPDIWTADDGWRVYDGDVKLTSGGALATFTLGLPANRRLRVAAQPILLPEETIGWMDDIASANPSMTIGVLGQSAEGRDIPYLESGAGIDRWVLLLGRQHPPETTGAIAMEAFMKRISVDDELANAFRDQVGFLSIPMLNPDGVVAGNWRLDSTGKDLNRDWGPFEKPETALVRDAIDARVNDGRQLILGLDFHSTKKDVLYTQPDGEDDAGAIILSDWFTPVWHQAINKRLSAALPDEEPMAREGAHNPESPNFKTWINVAHSVPGITVEFGDETRPERLKTIGEIAAEEMMRLFLSDAPPK